MSQRMEIKDGEEDWTGKSSTAERRKLQNRLNQRALRMLSAPNFESFVKTPLPSDQKLLTLMHFNFVRALAHNVFILGFNPDEMDSEVESPFTSAELKISTEALPETLRPTELQKIVPHHPGLDLFPFPRWRDNMLRRGWTHPKNEYSVDLLYGVESEALGRDCGLPGRTGLIAWGESWLQESWEIEEGFARKYSDLFDGCEELLESTNQWRARRGEGPLILKVEEDEWES
ncbi:hypothetical protein N431DRAFT_535686 [Stipitochalara longipes BDJ]|nr:hypothetical protein N431DRAFT_535686 [Stipitochalara longipes BDJ]